jgi:hypothetical protein
MNNLRIITEFSDIVFRIAFHLAIYSFQYINQPTKMKIRNHQKSSSHKLKITAFVLLALGCSAFVLKVDSPNIDHAVATLPFYENESDQSLFSGPIDSNQTADAVARFVTDYKTDVGLNYAPIKIKVNQALKRVFTLFPIDSNSGMTFHYGLSDDAKELCYIIAPGTRLQSTDELYYRPFPTGMHNQPNDHYILLKNNGSDSIEYITQSEFCQLTENYELNMKRKSGGSFAPISSDPSHPRYVYHEGIELNKFIDSYSEGSSLHLYIEHGAMEPAGASNFYHAACFLFGDDRNSFPLNNVDYPSAGLDTPYRSKAMDLGQLCPPHCGTLPRALCP